MIDGSLEQQQLGDTGIRMKSSDPGWCANIQLACPCLEQELAPENTPPSSENKTISRLLVLYTIGPLQDATAGTVRPSELLLVLA
ncbi:hypothetical protein VTJ49DRAFT_5814 [Mycothermus thermophilus]|uniref:Uncharacterized protein n=1 Tax=Humicola insolens TaxID=85995 RepID=A0ABR3VQW8_HUMIN